MATYTMGCCSSSYEGDKYSNFDWGGVAQAGIPALLGIAGNLTGGNQQSDNARATAEAEARAAEAAAEAARSKVELEEAKSKASKSTSGGFPSWAMYAIIGVGVLLVGVITYIALRKK